MKKILIFIFLNMSYISIYASENPLTNIVNNSAWKVLNEASILWWDDFKLTITILIIIIAFISWLIIIFKKK